MVNPQHYQSMEEVDASSKMMLGWDIKLKRMRSQRPDESINT